MMGQQADIPREEMLDLLKTKTQYEVARHYGVAQSTISRHLLKTRKLVPEVIKDMRKKHPYSDEPTDYIQWARDLRREGVPECDIDYEIMLWRTPPKGKEPLGGGPMARVHPRSNGKK